MGVIMEIGVSTYSYSKKTKSIAKAFDFAASQGFKFVEIADGGKGLFARIKFAKLKRHAESLGLTVYSYVFGANLASPVNRSREVKRIKGQIDLAHTVGAKLIRHDILPWGSDDDTFERHFDEIVASERDICHYAAKYGITVTVENHGLYLQQIADLDRLYKAVDKPNFKLLGDMGNFMCGDVDPKEAFTALAPYFAHVHAKDFYFKPKTEKHPAGYFKSRGGNYLCGSVIGDGVVPVEDCLNVLKNVGYDGKLVIEYEGQDDPLTGIAQSKDFLKHYLS